MTPPHHHAEPAHVAALHAIGQTMPRHLRLNRSSTLKRAAANTQRKRQVKRGRQEASGPLSTPLLNTSSAALLRPVIDLTLSEGRSPRNPQNKPRRVALCRFHRRSSEAVPTIASSGIFVDLRPRGSWAPWHPRNQSCRAALGNLHRSS